jgi:hypothetical protein
MVSRLCAQGPHSLNPPCRRAFASLIPRLS